MRHATALTDLQNEFRAGEGKYISNKNGNCSEKVRSQTGVNLILDTNLFTTSTARLKHRNLPHSDQSWNRPGVQKAETQGVSPWALPLLRPQKIM